MESRATRNAARSQVGNLHFFKVNNKILLFNTCNVTRIHMKIVCLQIIALFIGIFKTIVAYNFAFVNHAV